MTTPAGPSGAPIYPLRTKIIIAVVLTVAVGAFVLAFVSVNTDTDPEIVGGAPGQASSAQGVQAVVPGDGAQVLAQQRVGIRLADGWTGELTLQPASGAAIPLPLDQLEPGTQNELIFQPGEGKAIERLPTGNNCMLAVIWSRVDGRDATERVEQWCFQVT